MSTNEPNSPSIASQSAANPVNPHKAVQGEKLRGAEKVARIPVKVIPTETMLRKPEWIRVRVPATPKIDERKKKLRKHK